MDVVILRIHSSSSDFVILKGFLKNKQTYTSLKAAIQSQPMKIKARWLTLLYYYRAIRVKRTRRKNEKRRRRAQDQRRVGKETWSCKKEVRGNWKEKKGRRRKKETNWVGKETSRDWKRSSITTKRRGEKTWNSLKERSQSKWRSQAIHKLDVKQQKASINIWTK